MNEQYITLVGKVCSPRYEEVYTPEVKSKLPIEASSEGRNLKDYTIYGNNNPNHVDESQSILPVSIDTYGGNAVDWEIFGNNNPVVEDKASTLPIDASATAGNLLDWTINGNNNSGKNVVQLGESQTINGVTLTIDSQAGTVIMNGDTTAAEAGFSFNLFDTSSLVSGDYIFSGGADGGSSTTYDLYLYNRTDQVYVGRLYNSSDIISATIESGKRYTVYVQCRKGQVYDNIVFKPMLRPANTTSTFEPYTIGVGERTKNLISVSNVTADTGVTIVDADEATGSLKLSSSVQYRGGRFDFNFEDGKTYTISVINNIATSNARIAFRRVGTNTIVSSVSLGTTGVKTATLTFSSTDYPNGVYVSLICNMSADDVPRTIDLSNLMLVEGSSMLTDFIPYGYQIPLDIQHKTKNLLDITGYNRNHYSVLWYEDNGQLKASGTYSDSAAHTWPRFYVELGAGTYTLSGSPDYEQNGVQVQLGTCTDNQDSNFSLLGYDTGSGYTFTLQAGSWVSVRVYTASRLYQQTVDLTLPIMLRPADTSPNFEPYYLTNHEDIYIGNSPLIQGQSITKAQSGQDITLFSGDNIIDTTLYNKPNTSITYNSSVLGVGQKTKNLLKITAETQTINGVTFSVNKESGTVTANGTANGITQFHLRIGCPSGNYYFSGCASGGSNSTYYIIAWDNTLLGRVKQWDGVTNSLNDYGTEANEIKVDSTHSQQLTITIMSGYTANNVVFKPMLRPSGTSTDFAPYGYQIPLLVTSGQQSTPHTIYIGSAPLTEGQSATKASSGTDIALYQGNNTISTTLGNKPEMKIDYLSTVIGVGERTENLFDGNYQAAFISTTNNKYRALTGGRTAVIQCDSNTQYTISVWNGCNRLVVGESETEPQIGDAVNILAAHTSTIPQYITITTGANVHYIACYVSNQSNAPTISIVKGSTAPSTYEPYGYQIPIDIKQGDEVVDHKNIYIGTQPLEEGASVSKVSVGEDITLVSGENYIDTDLFNKPEMYIK